LKGGLPEGHGDKSILAQAVRELARYSWGHHVELLNKVKDPAARLLLSRDRETRLEPQCAAESDQGQGLRIAGGGKTHNFPAVLPEYLAEQAEEALKARTI
jgi:hypothetical protein